MSNKPMVPARPSARAPVMARTNTAPKTNGPSTIAKGTVQRVC